MGMMDEMKTKSEKKKVEVRRKRGGVGCGGAGSLRMAGIVMTTIEITAGRILIRQVMYIY